MTLSDYALGKLKTFVTGDHELMPRQTGPELVDLFNSYGEKDFYDHKSGGLPDSQSRNQYTFERLRRLNSKKGLKELIENIFSERHFQNKGLDINSAVQSVNAILKAEGYELMSIQDKFKITGRDAYLDEKTSEIHFEEIQRQIKDEVTKAKYMIWVAVAWFTDRELYDLLITKRKEGLSVQVMILDDDINNNSGLTFRDFYTIKVPKAGRYENIMHHKFCIIDLKTVVHGSYNWTNKARYNNETIDVEVNRENAEKFADQFLKLKTGT